MKRLFDEQKQLALDNAGVVAVLMVDSEQDAVPLAEALLEGGVRVMELTLRTDAAWGALANILRGAPDMMAGMGTVLTPDQVMRAQGEGAAFAVSPGFNARVVQQALESGLSFAPGIMTPSDIEAALEFGARLLKFFPCEPAGGLPYLKSMAAPYLHLGVRFIPLGGVNEANLSTYLNDPLIAAIGGSWIAPRDLIKDRNWKQITANARQAMKIAAARNR